eukprot:CAMPEP_0184553268 /NCGR_PEP_ID=MMETSP0199_2-20130426/31491_1 /TAXON_ID=1112570 /ORGANISM="Thraustochytrium sp., Strain LLF1b" /LENGTH=68 /DNA_ID=CAMNT_0026948975 /DNA_START=255 /DNA_END=458 /DNA_ORIENTATION=-
MSHQCNIERLGLSLALDQKGRRIELLTPRTARDAPKSVKGREQTLADRNLQTLNDRNPLLRAGLPPTD